MSKIYRYRILNNYSLNALSKFELSFTSPSEFNDPFDCFIKYNVDDIIKYFNDNLNLKKILIEYDYYYCNKKKPTYEELSEYISNYNHNLIFKPLIEEYCLSALKTVRDYFFVACFSENVNNTVLWAYYANDSRGFCLEYDEDMLLKLIDKYCKSKKISNEFNYIFNVNYLEEFPDRTDLMIKILTKYVKFLNKSIGDNRYKRIDFELTLNDIKSIFLNKTINWRYEEEKRIIIPKKNLDLKFDSVDIIVPTSIYLGNKTEFWAADFLYFLCQNSNIKLFRMNNVYGNNIDLKPIPVGIMPRGK